MAAGRPRGRGAGWRSGPQRMGSGKGGRAGQRPERESRMRPAARRGANRRPPCLSPCPCSELRSIHLRTLNKERAEIIAQHWLRDGRVPSPRQVRAAAACAAAARAAAGIRVCQAAGCHPAVPSACSPAAPSGGSGRLGRSSCPVWHPARLPACACRSARRSALCCRLTSRVRRRRRAMCGFRSWAAARVPSLPCTGLQLGSEAPWPAGLPACPPA